jgi:hypothetical protein
MFGDVTFAGTTFDLKMSGLSVHKLSTHFHYFEWRMECLIMRINFHFKVLLVFSALLFLEKMARGY